MSLRREGLELGAAPLGGGGARDALGHGLGPRGDYSLLPKGFTFSAMGPCSGKAESPGLPHIGGCFLQQFA